MSFKRVVVASFLLSSADSVDVTASLPSGPRAGMRREGRRSSFSGGIAPPPQTQLVTNADLHAMFGPCACILSSGNLFGEVTLMKPAEESQRTATIISREVLTSSACVCIAHDYPIAVD